MSSSHHIGTSGLDPFAPFAEVAHQVVQWAPLSALSVCVGIYGARKLSDHGLRESWSLTLAAAALMARAPLGRITWLVLLASLVAWLSGRRRRRAALESGADLAALARAQTGPLGVVATAVRAKRSGAAVARNRRLRGGDLPIGVDERHRIVSVPLGDETGGRHILVLGATGSGKTVTQTSIAVQAIQRGMGAVVIDPKGDRALSGELRRSAAQSGRAFIEWTPSGPHAYNPFARGSATEIADKALAGERFTEPHYLRQSQRYLGHVIRAVRASGAEVSLRRIVDGLDPERLELLARALPEAEADRTHAYLDRMSTRQRGDLAGVRDRLAIMAESDIGPWLDPDTPGSRSLDLLDAVCARAVVYFSLESDLRPLLAQMMGAAVVQDLQGIVAMLQGQPIATLVVIDEFSAVAADQVVRLFGRARSAAFSLLLGTQELSDLRLPGREQLLEQVMGNLSALVVHRQVVPASAELVAAVAGGRGAWRVSRRSDGGTTRTRVREALIDADTVMRLGPGAAAVIVPGATPGVRVARIFAPAQLHPARPLSGTRDETASRS